MPSPPDHPLARSFLQEIAGPFGDRNPKGSATRVLRILARATLEPGDVVLCLVRAATIARQTQTLRPAHYDPHTGQANRMPLFCSLFERFVQARLHQGKWNYSWQQMEDDLAADDRLQLWWTEHQALLDKAVPEPQEKPLPANLQAGPHEWEEASFPIVGGLHRESALYWGEQLLEKLVKAGYEAEVRVHLEGQCYQLLLVEEEDQWVLETPGQVQSLMKDLEASSLFPAHR